MEVHLITAGKRRYLPLLLLGDEQEDMIARYLDRGALYAIYDRAEEPGACGSCDCDNCGLACEHPTVRRAGLRAVCVVTDEGNGVYELKNLSVCPPYQRQGYGRRVIDFLEHCYRGMGRVLTVGTRDSPLTLPFYKKCGFQITHRVKNFFIEHYDHPIFEGGKQLVDMVYLKMDLE